MARERLLFLDEDVPKRLARELCDRGRTALSIYSTDLKGLTDPPLMRGLLDRFTVEEFVLVTADDSMPGVHASVVAETGLTIATVDGRHEPDYPREDQDAWKREIIHRWAHTMQAQVVGTQRRYSLARHGKWTQRRRP